VAANDSLRQGISGYENGDFDLAIVKLNLAINTGKNADLVTAYKYLALALIGKGQTGKAEAALRRAIELNPSLKLNPNEHSSKVINLFQKVRGEMFDTLTIVSNPTGAIVFVDDERKGITPTDTGVLKLEALVGKRHIKVSKRYFEDNIIDAKIVKNGQNTITIDLEPTRIGLWIKTEPSNANVFIDDKFSGVTPTIIDTVMGAKLSAKLAKEGYQDKRVDIQIKQSGVAQVDGVESPLINEIAYIAKTLELLPPGQLEIISDPPNAEVYLDAKLQGKTPLKLDNIAAGKHRLRFHLEQFDDVVQSVEVISKKTVAVQCKLGGVLSVTSLPPGAEVYLGQTHLGKTPVVTGQMPQKPHYLKLIMPGYVDEICEVVSTSGVTEIKVKLTKKTGSLAIDSNPPGVAIYLDGEKHGITPMVLYGVPLGKYDLRLTKPGYDEWSGRIQVEHRKVTWRYIYLRKR
jgi:tetratricopeptide (TPR) repeat protein